MVQECLIHHLKQDQLSDVDYSEYAFGGVGNEFTVKCTVDTSYAIKESYWTFDGVTLKESKDK